MSYGSFGAGLGGPVGGVAPAYGSDSSFPTSPLDSGGSLFDFGSTLNSNLVLSGLGNILQGAGELLQSGAADGNAGFAPVSPDPQTNTGGQTDGTGNTTGPQGLDQLLQSITGALDDILKQVNALVNAPGTQQAPSTQQAPAPQQEPAPAPQPQLQPQPDPVANLVNRANVDPALVPTVTQIAQDPVGNKLLEGAVNGGLAGIQVKDLPAGFFGQYLPGTQEVQIGQGTLQGNDLVRTVAHELVHAATPRDGDSIREEGVADQIGTEVQRRITGIEPGYTLGGESYNSLPQDNGVINSLLQLGITFNG